MPVTIFFVLLMSKKRLSGILNQQLRIMLYNANLLPLKTILVLEKTNAFFSLQNFNKIQNILPS